MAFTPLFTVYFFGLISSFVMTFLSLLPLGLTRNGNATTRLRHACLSESLLLESVRVVPPEVLWCSVAPQNGPSALLC